jgi:inner membrane protein involved in colicin E2 resistance
METTESTITKLIDKGKLFFKAVIIFVMAFFLWIPTNLIRDVINEREGRQREAIEEVSSKWAGKQTITGPILMIPYNGTAANGIAYQKKYAWFMADMLDITSSVAPQKRHRGIYDVVVYGGNISLTAKFNEIKLKQLPVPVENLLWAEAKILICHGVSVTKYLLNGKTVACYVNPGPNPIQILAMPYLHQFLWILLMPLLKMYLQQNSPCMVRSNSCFRRQPEKQKFK